MIDEKWSSIWKKGGYDNATVLCREFDLITDDYNKKENVFSIGMEPIEWVENKTPGSPGVFLMRIFH